jgi:hypothetical protein
VLRLLEDRSHRDMLATYFNMVCSLHFSWVVSCAELHGLEITPPTVCFCGWWSHSSLLAPPLKVGHAFSLQLDGWPWSPFL